VASSTVPWPPENRAGLATSARCRGPWLRGYTGGPLQASKLSNFKEALSPTDQQHGSWQLASFGPRLYSPLLNTQPSGHAGWCIELYRSPLHVSFQGSAHRRKCLGTLFHCPRSTPANLQQSAASDSLTIQGEWKQVKTAFQPFLHIENVIDTPHLCYSPLPPAEELPACHCRLLLLPVTAAADSADTHAVLRRSATPTKEQLPAGQGLQLPTPQGHHGHQARHDHPSK